MYLAFPEYQLRGLSTFDEIVNVFFAIDVIMNFFLAYEGKDFKLVTDNKVRNKIKSLKILK